jgi:hypothetical protein
MGQLLETEADRANRKLHGDEKRRQAEGERGDQHEYPSAPKAVSDEKLRILSEKIINRLRNGEAAQRKNMKSLDQKRTFG